MTAPRVGAATAEQTPALVRTLVRAYESEPIMNFAFRAGAERERAWSRYFEVMIGIYRRQGLVLSAAEGRACALWAPPDRWKPGFWLELRHALDSLAMLGLSRLRRGWSVKSRMEREHAKEPHYYLCLLGVDSELRRNGIGTALVNAGLALADEAGVGAYLETADPENPTFYARLGFRTTKEIELGPGGPHCWLMWRDPAQTSPDTAIR